MALRKFWPGEIFKKYIFKGYLRYKSIFCHKVAIDVKLMNFFYLKKK